MNSIRLAIFLVVLVSTLTSAREFPTKLTVHDFPCLGSPERAQVVYAMTGGKHLDLWRAEPEKIHVIEMPNNFRVGLKIENAPTAIYQRNMKAFGNGVTEELVQISIYDMTTEEPQYLTHTFGGSNSIQGYSAAGGATGVQELGNPGITLHLMKPVCVTEDDLSRKYTIKTEIHKGTDLISSPVLLVSDGKAASIRTSGNDGYAFDVTVTEYDSDSVLVETSFEDGDSEVNPSVLAEFGSPVSMKIGELTLTMSINVEISSKFATTATSAKYERNLKP